MQRCEIHVKNETLTPLNPYLVSRGVPFPPGAVRSARQVSVRDAKGRVIPSSAKVLQKRPDGSVEWALVDVLLPLGPQESTSIFVEPKAAAAVAPKRPVVLRREGDRFTLANGHSEVSVSRAGGSVIERLVVNGKVIVERGDLVDLQLVDGSGKIHRASLAGKYKVVVQHQNPLVTTLRVEGKHKARDGSVYLDFALRVTLVAGHSDVKLEHTFYCREQAPARHLVRSMKLVMPTRMDPASTKVLRQQNHGHNWVPRELEIKENVEVVASSAGDIDAYAANNKGAAATHPCAGGAVFLRSFESLHEDWSKYPFYMRPGQGSGFRADLQITAMRAVHPIVGWREKGYTFVTTFEHFRQLHPKSILIDENVITWSIWPEWSTPMVLLQGVSKSHILWITGERAELDIDQIDALRFRWEYGYVEPVDISFDPAWPAHCAVLDCGDLLKHQPDKYPLLENLIEPVPSAGNPGRHTYDRQSATGMFHFGDHVNPEATSCSNNEDDCNVLFPLQHFLRTGQTYAWDYGKESARHYMEVDHCEWSTDPRQSGGLIPHTGQHFIGNVYPSHQWSEGILAYYYMTGDERARDVVVRVGDNNVWWTYNNLKMVICDGREAGMPLVNLAAAYRLTQDAKYVKAAKHICENFFVKWTKKFGSFKYPYPQGLQEKPQKLITGYGDWSSFAGLYRMWEVTGDEYFRKLGVELLTAAVKPELFSFNDARGMDFFAAWALGKMTGDMEYVMKACERAAPMLLRRGGHPLRRLHFLKEMDERGMIDEKMVGNRAGSI
ncbi:MAG: hypothetical protein NTW19_16980 [Planctomycetota bacterium]|nr:hypothetical protein [Planctomycetota bacterium]